MTVIRLRNGGIMLHSPCHITPELKTQIRTLGPVCCIVAPGNFHYLHVPSAQAAFPEAKTWLCPGVEAKRPDLLHVGLLGDTAPGLWAAEMEQVLVRGSRWMREVAFFHKSSRTLILVDLVENFTDKTPGTDWVLRLWWKRVFFMWNRPRPAPEYRMGWKDRRAAAQSLRRILEWDFSRVILAHGDLIEQDAHKVLEEAWHSVLDARQGA